MRKKLQKRNGERLRVHATFERHGTKSSFKGPPKKTLLFVDVTDEDGNKLTDHIWMNTTKAFEALHLEYEDRVAFDARVKRYESGYKGWREDVYKPVTTNYKLNHPTKVEKL